MAINTEALYEGTKESLERIQRFDTAMLVRESELGIHLNFGDAREPAQFLINLYRQLSVTALQDFPDSVLTRISDNANNHYNLFSQALSFNPNQQNPKHTRDDILNKISNAYRRAFEELHPYIAYSLYRSADFQKLDANARATLHSIEDEASKISKVLAQHEKDALVVLNEIRQVAEEEGVTKQATHFSAEYRHHETEAARWQKYLVYLSIVLGLFAIVSLFIHKIPYLKPETTYDAVQLSISKFLIFFVVSYMLFLSAKNFLNHKHNAIVNKHRQNALMTYTALVEASGSEGVRDAVLLQAANCIFSPQSTGYASSDSDISNQKSVVEILSKPVMQAMKDVNN